MPEQGDLLASLLLEHCYQCGVGSDVARIGRANAKFSWESKPRLVWLCKTHTQVYQRNHMLRVLPGQRSQNEEEIPW